MGVAYGFDFSALLLARPGGTGLYTATTGKPFATPVGTGWGDHEVPGLNIFTASCRQPASMNKQVLSQAGLFLPASSGSSWDWHAPKQSTPTTTPVGIAWGAGVAAAPVPICISAFGGEVAAATQAPAGTAMAIGRGSHLLSHRIASIAID